MTGSGEGQIDTRRLIVPGLAGLNVFRQKLRRGGAGVRGTSGAGSIGEEVEEERCDG